MDNYTGDLSVEEELAPVPVTPERWAKQFRTRDFGNEIPDVLNGWWYRTCSGYLPHPVDEVMNIGSTRAFLFTGPEGTGKYTTAMLLASNLKDRGFSCYSLAGEDFDIWKGDRMTSALQAVAVGQKETETGETEIEGRTVIIRYPEECRRFKRLQKALYSVYTYCEEMDLPLFLIVITQAAGCERNCFPVFSAFRMRKSAGVSSAIIMRVWASASTLTAMQLLKRSAGRRWSVTQTASVTISFTGSFCWLSSQSRRRLWRNVCMFRRKR